MCNIKYRNTRYEGVEPLGERIARAPVGSRNFYYAVQSIACGSETSLDDVVEKLGMNKRTLKDYSETLFSNGVAGKKTEDDGKTTYYNIYVENERMLSNCNNDVVKLQESCSDAAKLHENVSSCCKRTQKNVPMLQDSNFFVVMLQENNKFVENVVKLQENSRYVDVMLQNCTKMCSDAAKLQADLLSNCKAAIEKSVEEQFQKWFPPIINISNTPFPEGIKKEKKENKKEKTERTGTDVEQMSMFVDETTEEANVCNDDESLNAKRFDDDTFEYAWECYKRRGSKKAAFEQWKKIKGYEKKQRIIEYIKHYAATRDVQYMKHFQRFLRDEAYEEPIRDAQGNVVFDINNSEFKVEQSAIPTANKQYSEKTLNEIYEIEDEQKQYEAFKAYYGNYLEKTSKERGDYEQCVPRIPFFCRNTDNMPAFCNDVDEWRREKDESSVWSYWMDTPERIFDATGIKLPSREEIDRTYEEYYRLVEMCDHKQMTWEELDKKIDEICDNLMSNK